MPDRPEVRISSKPDNPISIAVLGATGRVGRGLVRAIAADPQLHLVGATASPDAVEKGSDIGQLVGLDPLGVVVGDDPAAALHGADVAIDFSLPEATARHIDASLSAGSPLVIGTTGLDARIKERIDEAADRIALLVAANTSLGVNLMFELVKLAATRLDETFDLEVLEVHHRHKRDAPSGTALRLGEVLAAARGRDLSELAELGESVRSARPGPRRSGEIGFASIRAGDIVGEHTVLFAGDDERLEITHRATDRAVFVRGALAGARWLIQQPPGEYSMANVLGF